jgi:hypothetical protein
MATWVGLVGVLAGALIAFGGQYMMGRREREERNAALLLEQCAVLIALSEDFRNRVWEERHNVATDVVGQWDLGAYRLAEARLRVLSPDPGFQAAVTALRRSGTDLGKAWRLGTSDEAAVESAWTAYEDSVEMFTNVSSRVIRHGPARSPLRLAARRQDAGAVL